MFQNVVSGTVHNYLLLIEICINDVHVAKDRSEELNVKYMTLMKTFKEKNHNNLLLAKILPRLNEIKLYKGH